MFHLILYLFVESIRDSPQQIVAVPAQELREKFELSVLAGDPVSDICMLKSGWVLPAFAGKSYLHPADRYFNTADSLWNPYITKQAVYKGHPMGVNHLPLTSYSCLLYNRSWVWKIRKNSYRHGSGIPPVQQAIASNGTLIVSEANGTDTLTLKSPQAKEALEWVRDLIGLGVTGGSINDFSAGKVAFYWWDNDERSFISTIKDKWGILPCPIGPKAKDYTAWSDNIPLICLPVKTRYTKENADIWTEMCRWYPGVSGRDQLQRDIYKVRYQNSKDVETAVLLSSKFKLDKYLSYPKIAEDMFQEQENGDSLHSILNYISNITLDQWLGSKIPEYEKAIRDLWSQYK